MKRIVSFLLVAILIVTCMSVSVMAVAGNPGGTATVTCSVSGEFSDFTVQLSTDPGLTITSINGITGNAGTGRAAWASNANTDKVTFTVTVQIAGDIKPGSYNVYANLLKATKIVPADQDTEDGIAEGHVAAAVSVTGGVVVIEEATCNHADAAWKTIKEADCVNDGVEHLICPNCGKIDERAIPALGHLWGVEWAHNDETHWHECARCGEHKDDSAHTWEWVVDLFPTYASYGRKHEECVICGHHGETALIPMKVKDPEDDPVPGTGDITNNVNLGIFALVVGMFSVVAIVNKRRTAK